MIKEKLLAVGGKVIKCLHSSKPDLWTVTTVTDASSCLAAHTEDKR